MFMMTLGMVLQTLVFEMKCEATKQTKYLLQVVEMINFVSMVFESFISQISLQIIASVRLIHPTKIGAIGYDAERIDGFMRSHIVVFDVCHVHSIANRGHLENSKKKEHGREINERRNNDKENITHSLT